MRFRTAGTNWAGQEWQLSEALIMLGTQISGIWPAGQPTDGTVASKAHDAASPGSDHRPDPLEGLGTVRALDVGEVGDQGAELFEALRVSRDPRIKYAIHDGEMFSSYPKGSYGPFEVRPYYGGGHGTHVHTSTLDAADNDPRAWDLANLGGAAQPPPPPSKEYTLQITRKTIRLGAVDAKGYGGPVSTAQGLLVSKGYWAGAKASRGQVITGTFDAVTDRLVKAYQDRHGLAVDGIVGPITWGSLEETR